MIEPLYIKSALPHYVISHRLGALQVGHPAWRSPLPPSSLPVSTRKEDFSQPSRTSRKLLLAISFQPETSASHLVPAGKLPPAISYQPGNFRHPSRTSRYCLPPPEATSYHHLVLVRDGRENGYEKFWVRDVRNPLPKQQTTRQQSMTKSENHMHLGFSHFNFKVRYYSKTI
jgi:hypothetical protein